MATAALVRIVSRLNDLGHDLHLYYPAKPGDIAYQDIRDGRVRLRVAYDSVISTGYAHVISPEKLEAEELEAEG